MSSAQLDAEDRAREGLPRALPYAVRHALLAVARDLMPDTQGSNPEYVKGMVDLIVNTTLLPGDDYDEARHVCLTMLEEGL